MGVDVQLHAAIEVTDVQLAEANKLYRSLTSFGDPEYFKDKEPLMISDYFYEDYVNFMSHRLSDEYGPIVEVCTLSRYYGDWGGKGQMPHILEGIRALQKTFPDAPIFYNSDSGGPPTLVTEEYLGEITAHWNEHNPEEKL